MGGGSAGDKVELVALDVGERGPSGAAAHVELSGAERDQALGLALVVTGYQVRMEPVLDALGLGDLVERKPRSRLTGRPSASTAISATGAVRSQR
ncbi:MAG TPA: hypothetical protein VN969_19475 [Streptosporangiaceae bacterium]|nr:hypothetical protein [Streptosporangiaceae bacterium]